MSRRVGDAVARCGRALAVVLGGTGALLMLSLLATTGAPSAAVFAAVVAGVAAVAASAHRLPVPAPHAPLGARGRYREAGPLLRAGCVTDSPRHPLRPRAPGQV